MNPPKVVVYSLGGTISMGRRGKRGVESGLTSQDLIAAVPGVSELADIEAHSFRQTASGELTVSDIRALAETIQRNFDEDEFVGAVVTQGTDTIEETAFLLDLMVRSNAPIAITGAMRNPTLLGADGTANISAAVRVAISPAARGLGSVVVFTDEIHAACYVRKTHTQSLGTFRSITGPIGWLSEEAPRIAVRPPQRPYYPPQSLTSNEPPVALITLGLGEPGYLLDCVSPSGYRGLIIEAYGGGHVPSWVAARLERLVQEMPVVLASRTRAGEVMRKTYGFAGSETDLMDKGLINAGWLDAFKARLLLTLLLSQNRTADEIREEFGAYNDRLTAAG